MTQIRLVSALLLSTASISLPATAFAQQEQSYSFDLPADTLGNALRAVAAKSGIALYAPAEIDEIRAPRVRGKLSVRQAIENLLKGTGFQAKFTDDAVTIQPRTQSETEESDPSILVTGSRIRGAPIAAPVTTITSLDMERAGQADLGEAIRSSPLDFGGGQNPGIGNTQGASANTNVNGATSVNLLGLGPSATLTLLNGSRLSYTSINAAVDINAIPSAAVERLEIVADGSSAIYGADAVAGVVNVILRRDYNGLTAEGRLGGATSGGDFEQQYNLVGGRTWAGGGVLAVYDYSSNTAIAASSRDYASSMASDSALYPAIRRYSALVSGHQDLGDRLTVNLDALFKNTWHDKIIGYVAGQPHTYSGGESIAKDVTVTIAPSLTARLGADWTAHLLTSYSQDRTRLHSDNYSASVLSSTSYRRYDNNSISIEANADGPLFELPAGAVRLAIGGGYRRSGLTLVMRNGDVTSSDFALHRDNTFGYAETFIPLLAPDQEAPLAHSLSLTGAFRYEANSGTSSAAVPKIGVIYEPVGGLTLKGSWGRSFRIPTFYEQYNGYALVLFDASDYSSSYAAGTQALYQGGSNTGLKPERSENWTLSAEVKPDALPGFTGTIGMFRFNYKDRIAVPISSISAALNDPNYASVLTANPSVAQQAELLANVNSDGLQSAFSGTYDPNTVAVLIDGRYQNLARELYRGMTLSLRYSFGDPGHQKVDLSFDGLWLNSERQLLPGQTASKLAGMLFNPPKLKGRFGAAYTTPEFTVSAFANLSSNLTDARSANVFHIHGPRTVDLSAVVHAGDGLDFGASVINLFGAEPPSIVTSSGYDTPFDSTNYSAVGRFMSVRVRKSW